MICKDLINVFVLSKKASDFYPLHNLVPRVYLEVYSYADRARFPRRLVNNEWWYIASLNVINAVLHPPHGWSPTYMHTSTLVAPFSLAGRNRIRMGGDMIYQVSCNTSMSTQSFAAFNNDA